MVYLSLKLNVVLELVSGSFHTGERNSYLMVFLYQSVCYSQY